MNEDNILGQLAIIGARDFTFPLRVLAILSRTCKYIFTITQWRIDKSKLIYERWVPRFAPVLHKRLIGHPFKYTGTLLSQIAVSEMGFSEYGLRVFDVSGGLFPADFKSRVSFADIGFFTHSRVPFAMAIIVVDSAILFTEVAPEQYIDMGADERAVRGRYYVKLGLPTRINPITLGPPIIDFRLLHFNISHQYEISYEGLDMIFSPQFIAEHFTHAVVEFKTIDENAHDWSKYGLTFNGKIDNHASTTSFIRRLDITRADS